MSVAELKEAAAHLPPSDQAELATWLLNLLPSSSEEDAIEDSVAEARLRKAELDSGKSIELSSAEFWQSLDAERRITAASGPAPGR